MIDANSALASLRDANRIWRFGTGGIATLNHRLMAGIPTECGANANGSTIDANRSWTNIGGY